VRQESDARHQEKFDRDSPLSCIVLELDADASREFGDASRSGEARRRRLAATVGAQACVLGEKQKTTLIVQHDACGRSARACAAAVSRRSRDRRRRPLRLVFAERREERMCVR
jgi:hypothetical protein